MKKQYYFSIIYIGYTIIIYKGGISKVLRSIKKLPYEGSFLRLFI